MRTGWLFPLVLLLGLAMRVEAAPTIITQPQALAVTMGDHAVFSVYATGTGTLSYQWKKNGAPISSATGDYYRIASVAYGDAGNYSVDVTDSGGTTASSAAGREGADRGHFHDGERSGAGPDRAAEQRRLDRFRLRQRAGRSE